MKRRAWLVPLSTAVVGTGLAVGVNLATDDVSNVFAWSTVVVLTLAAACLSTIPGLRSSHHGGLPSSIDSLVANSDFGKQRNFQLVEKQLFAEVAEGTSYRREAKDSWKIRIRNTSKRQLTQIRLPLLGEVPVNEDDLQARVRFPSQSQSRKPRIDGSDRHSPSIICDLPTPGLPPGAEMTIEYGCVWPGVAHIRADRWTLDVSNMAPSRPVSLEVAVPRTDEQEAWGEVVSRRFGRFQRSTLGSVPGIIRDDRVSYRIDFLTQKRSLFLILHLTAADALRPAED